MFPLPNMHSANCAWGTCTFILGSKSTRDKPRDVLPRDEYYLAVWHKHCDQYQLVNTLYILLGFKVLASILQFYKTSTIYWKVKIFCSTLSVKKTWYLLQELWTCFIHWAQKGLHSPTSVNALSATSFQGFADTG